MELAELVPELVRARREEGLTYEDALALALRIGVKVSLSKLWREMRAAGSGATYGVKPRHVEATPASRGPNARHQLWAKAHAAGASMAAIARAEGVRRQAVHAAIRRLQASDASATL